MNTERIIDLLIVSFNTVAAVFFVLTLLTILWTL
jgi:hypothetical protein